MSTSSKRARSSVFLNYRNDDSNAVAARLATDLREHFKPGQIFQDFSSISPGSEWSESLQQGLQTCAAVLVLIGRNWLQATDEGGRRRINLPDDWVRLEIATSLKSKDVRVFPILLDDAQMPRADDLPEDIRAITGRQAIQLTTRHWEKDVAALVAHLRHIPGLRGARLGSRIVFGTLGLVVSAGLVALVLQPTFREDPDPAGQPDVATPSGLPQSSSPPPTKAPEVAPSSLQSNPNPLEQDAQRLIAAQKAEAARTRERLSIEKREREEAEKQAQRQQLKQAFLKGDGATIQRLAEAAPGGPPLSFAARRVVRSWTTPDGKPVYQWDLFPAAASQTELLRSATQISYYMNHPSFEPKLMSAGPGNGFTASYTGWGCLNKVYVLIEYLDPGTLPRLTTFDQCASVKAF